MGIAHSGERIAATLNGDEEGRGEGVSCARWVHLRDGKRGDMDWVGAIVIEHGATRTVSDDEEGHTHGPVSDQILHGLCARRCCHILDAADQRAEPRQHYLGVGPEYRGDTT